MWELNILSAKWVDVCSVEVASNGLVLPSLFLGLLAGPDYRYIETYLNQCNDYIIIQIPHEENFHAFKYHLPVQSVVTKKKKSF